MSWSVKQREHIETNLPVAILGGSLLQGLIYLLCTEYNFSFLNEWLVSSVLWHVYVYGKIKYLCRQNGKNIIDSTTLVLAYKHRLFIIWLTWLYPTCYLFPNGNSEIQAFIAIILTGLATAAIPVHLLTPGILRLFFFTILTPFTLVAMLEQKFFGYLLAIASIAYIFILNVTSLRLYKILQNQHELAEKNRMLREELELRTSTLILNAKKASLGEIAGGMAHEINNPLAYIMASLELIKIKKQVEHDAIIDRILSHCLRISGIIKSLSYFSKKNIHDFFTKENLYNLVEKTLLIQKESLRAGKIEIRISISKQIEIECNAYDLGIAILNLVKNSQEAIFNLELKRIRILSEEVGDMIILKIIDSGGNIPSEIAVNMMQPFFSTKNSADAQGMGLAIAQEIIKNHNGLIFLDINAENTTFVIHLPKKQSSVIQREDKHLGKNA